MADNTEQLKKKPRNPSDEIDPETGEAYENIPGAEYPVEFQAGEMALSGPMAEGKVISNIAAAGGRKAARNFVLSALDKLKQKVPPATAEKMQKRAIMDPEFNTLMNTNPEAAAAKLARDEAQSKINYGTMQANKQYGPGESPAAAQPLDMQAINKRPGFNELDTASPNLDYASMNKVQQKPESPGLDYSQMNKSGIVKKLKKPGEV